MGSRPASMPGLPVGGESGRTGGDQGAVVLGHQRPCPADEIPHLGTESAVRLPPASDSGASEERNRVRAEKPRQPARRAPAALGRGRDPPGRDARAKTPVRSGRPESARGAWSALSRPLGDRQSPGSGRRIDLRRSGALPVLVAPHAGTNGRRAEARCCRRATPCARRNARGKSALRPLRACARGAFRLVLLRRAVECPSPRPARPPARRAAGPPASRVPTVRRCATVVTHPIKHVTRIAAQEFPRPGSGVEVQHVYICGRASPRSVHDGGQPSRCIQPSGSVVSRDVCCSAVCEQREDAVSLKFGQKLAFSLPSALDSLLTLHFWSLALRHQKCYRQGSLPHVRR